MAALFGVLSVVNVYTGTMFDIIFIYLMTVALAYYTFKFNEKMAVLVLFTSTFILFLTGELFFTLYSFFTLPLGILYIYCIKKKIDGKWILRVYSMLKNYIVLFLLNSLLGLNTFTDAKDIYYSIVGVFPFLESDFLKNVSDVLLQAQKNAKTAVNLSMVYAYYEIGRMIVEEEQHGENRATYGKKLLKELSTYLTGMFGKGYSAENLKLMRRFYSIYSHDQIGETVFTQFENLPAISTGRKFYLSWSHYLKLMRIDNIDERHFYEIECVKNDWSLSELKRQYNSALYERLALSTDKDKVYRLALEGQKVETPKDAVKDPYVLEFLGLKELPEYSESELESRIIDHLQQFLLELGTGFAFIGRQVRFTFDEEHFMVDLVFYNRLLRCFVLFDLKIGELKHQDIGQMQMYVNYYDRKVKLPDENKTIGIVLCRDKNNAVVEMTLPEDNSQIFASKYETVLPKKEDLKKLLEEQIAVENGGAEE